MEWRPLPAGITGWYWRPQPGPDCSLLALLLVSGPGDAVDLFWCSQQCGHNAYSECLSGKQTTKTTNARQSGEASLVPTAFAPVGVSKSPELGSLACALPKVARGGVSQPSLPGQQGLAFLPRTSGRRTGVGQAVRAVITASPLQVGVKHEPRGC